MISAEIRHRAKAMASVMTAERVVPSQTFMGQTLDVGLTLPQPWVFVDRL